jgi:type II secretory pathway pseudopilin PulG
MLELLVVMGIIAFLVGILVNVVGSALTTAKIKATKTTIQKIDGLLTQRMDAFTIAMGDQDLKGQNRQAVLKRKNLFRSGFPQTLLEAGLITSPTMDDPTDVTASSEALYEFLTRGESFGVPAVDEDAFTSSEVKDTDSDGRMEFVDAWGKPLRFYRWPTRLIRPAPLGDEATHQTIVDDDYYLFPLDPEFDGNTTGIDASILLGPLQAMPSGGMSRKAVKTQPLLRDEKSDPLAQDPDDPLGTIPASLRNPVDVENFEHNYHTPDTWWTPLIVSMGPDGELGLFEPVDSDNHGHLAQPDFSKIEAILDNLTNRKP